MKRSREREREEEWKRKRIFRQHRGETTEKQCGSRRASSSNNTAVRHYRFSSFWRFFRARTVGFRGLHYPATATSYRCKSISCWFRFNELRSPATVIWETRASARWFRRRSRWERWRWSANKGSRISFRRCIYRFHRAFPAFSITLWSILFLYFLL